MAGSSKRSAALLAAAVLAGAAGAYYLLRADQAPPPAQPAAPAAAGAAWLQALPARPAAVPSAQADTRQPGNLELRLMFDARLKGKGNPPSDLRRELAALPSPRREDSLHFLDLYLSYAQEHDALLARQQLGTPGQPADAGTIARLAAWGQQRHRLRAAVLGEALAQAWFSEDDAQFEEALSALRLAAGIGTEQDQARMPARPVNRTSPAQQAVDEQITQVQIANALAPYGIPSR